MKFIVFFKRRNDISFGKKLKSVNIKPHLQKIGSFLAGMIMPAIGILIAWGLWTSMFLYDYDNNKHLGWFNVPMLGKVVNPGIKYLLPILIAFNGGRMVYNIRGGMIGTFVILCTIVGTDHIYSNWIYMSDGTHPTSPVQFIGAMVLGPLSAYALKKIENLYLKKINSSYEMLVKNFGIGLLGIIIGLMTFFGWGWIMWVITLAMMNIISLFGNNKWVAPLLGIFTEPIKVSFLNNALNHGVLGPMGLQQIDLLKSLGISNPRSIFFLYDPNPGPGLGMLLAFIIFSKGEERTNATAAALIHTIGGIHEVYFVFILTRPKMLLATIAGVVAGQFIASYFDGGTIGTPSPGSIISLIALSPGIKAILVNIASFAFATLIALAVSGLLLIFSRKKLVNNNQVNIKFSDEGVTFINDNILQKNKINKIIVACEAGVGSSAMAAGIIKKYVKEKKFDIIVTNCAVKDIPKDTDIIVTMENFKLLAAEVCPNASIYPVKQFIGKDIYNELYQTLEINNEKE